MGGRVARGGSGWFVAGCCGRSGRLGAPFRGLQPAGCWVPAQVVGCQCRVARRCRLWAAARRLKSAPAVSMTCSPQSGPKQSLRLLGRPSERVCGEMGENRPPRTARPHHHWNARQLRAPPCSRSTSLFTTSIAHIARSDNERRRAEMSLWIGLAEPIQRHATCGGLINEYRTAA